MLETERHVALFEAAFTDKGAVHAYLASSLEFPRSYGANLDALLDCLGDISARTLIALIRMRGEGPLAPWFDKLALALMIAARENPALDVEIVFENEGARS